jgi:hypothetical protein
MPRHYVWQVNIGDAFTRPATPGNRLETDAPKHRQTDGQNPAA